MPDSHFTSAILQWYAANGRDLPWRRTRDPYAIWLSEIILQQTRIAQGQAYWERFMARFPDVESLAAASEDEVLLQGVVDCLLEEDGGLVVIDYKTDAIRTDEQLRERRELYTPQLRAYAAAMERIFKKPVKECVLYFLSMGKAARVGIG